MSKSPVQYSQLDSEMEIDKTGTKVYIVIKKETKISPQEILDTCLELVTDYCGITPEQWKAFSEDRDGGLN
jgi:hypothetical protein